jgi:hypothetical protein
MDHTGQPLACALEAFFCAMRRKQPPTEYVDNFVEKQAGKSAQAAKMRPCDKTMIKKAEKISMKSTACDVKPGVCAFFAAWRSDGSILWSTRYVRYPTKPAGTDV